MTMIWLFVVCVVAWALTAKLNKLSEAWAQLPHFVRNYVGGVLAFAGIADFKLAKQRRSWSRAGKFALVAETIVFSEHDEPVAFSGRLEWFYSIPRPRGDVSFPLNEEAPDLFVPFASEKYYSYEEQAKYFASSQNPEEFIQRKIKENLRSDYRMRFAVWAKKRNLCGWMWGFGIASCVMLLVAGFAAMELSEESMNKQEFVTYLNAKDGSVQSIKTTGRDTYTSVVRDDELLGTIVHGHVAKIQYVGGGNSRACIQRTNNNQLVCGFADSSLHLKVGDDAYTRVAEVLLWVNTATDGADQVFARWLITKTDALNLAATGKFTIVE